MSDTLPRSDPPELLETARETGARDPHALLDDARRAFAARREHDALGADALAERILRELRAERAAHGAREPSVWLRVAAAVLIAGAAALFARFALRAAKPAPAPTPTSTPAADAAECVKRDRAELEHALPLFARAGAAAGAQSSLLGELLVARSAGVAAYAFPAWLNEVARLPEAGPLERVLWAELLCDRYVLLGQHPLLLEELLGRAPDPAVAALHEHALARAERLGLRADGHGADVAGTPLSEAWLKQLAAQAAVQRDAQARRWVASALEP